MKLSTSIPAVLVFSVVVACRSSSTEPAQVVFEVGASLGVTTAVPSPEQVRDLALEFRVRQQGRVIESLAEASAAGSAGMQRGDVLLQLGQVTLYSQDDIDDFVALHAPGDHVRAMLVRKETGLREELDITLVPGEARSVVGIDWQYASHAQLPAALDRARAQKKRLLVGLSGAETWWPSTRFESGALSSLLNDPAVVRATQDYVRVIIRRPHAYWFLDEVTSEEGGLAAATPAGGVSATGSALPLPGLYLLDSDGELISTSALESIEEVLGMLEGSGPDSASAGTVDQGVSERVSLRVSGFMAAEGITWHGWPHRVQEVLDGLPGVLEVAADLGDARFDVTYDASLVTVEDFLASIRALDYEARVVDAPTERRSLADRIDPSLLPERLRKLFAEAATRRQLLLVEFTGPDWISCARMDAVTYPDTAVRAELSSWMEFRSDVAQEKQLATFFEVAAIPTAVLLHPDGRVLDRVVGFVEPEAFEKRLAAARSQL